MPLLPCPTAARSVGLATLVRVNVWLALALAEEEKAEEEVRRRGQRRWPQPPQPQPLRGVRQACLRTCRHSLPRLGCSSACHRRSLAARLLALCLL